MNLGIKKRPWNHDLCLHSEAVAIATAFLILIYILVFDALKLPQDEDPEQPSHPQEQPPFFLCLTRLTIASTIITATIIPTINVGTIL